MTKIAKLEGMPWPKKCAPRYHAQLGLSDKDRIIIVLLKYFTEKKVIMSFRTTFNISSAIQIIPNC